MKIVLFVGEIQPHANELIEFLQANEYKCINTLKPDEIDQVGQQDGQVLLIFTDANYAFRYLTENKWNGLRHLNAVYLHKKLIVNPDTQKKLDSKDLKVFDPSSKSQLLELLNGFRAFNSNADASDIEIEFSIHNELEEEQNKTNTNIKIKKAVPHDD